MSNGHDQFTRELAERAMKTAEAADRLALATSQNTELLEQRMDHFEQMDKERRQTLTATLLRIEMGVSGLYRRGWSFVITIVAGLFAGAGLIAGVAFWLGEKLARIPPGVQ